MPDFRRGPRPASAGKSHARPDRGRSKTCSSCWRRLQFERLEERQLLSAAQQPAISPAPLIITGSANDNVSITFSDATDFTVTINGGTPTAYNIANVDQVVYNGPAGAFSNVVFWDPVVTDAYTATQAFSSTTLVRSGGGFEFDANSVADLYIYVSDSSSTGAVTVAGDDVSNFFVDAANAGYSYIADPVAGIYSELSGFPAETVSGSRGSTYAYVYSASHATFVGDLAGSTFTLGGVTTTLNNFLEEFAVGASDGTDSITLNTDGNGLVATPSFTYVGFPATTPGTSVLFGALYAANVTVQATNSGDSAFVYSYRGDTYTGSQGTSTLTGSAQDFASFATFATQAVGFQLVTVQESGSGTDVANLTSPGGGTFSASPTVSSLSVNSMAVITVNTFIDTSSGFTAVPSRVNIMGNSNGSDTANLYDAPGSNALVAEGNQATLTTPINTVTVTQFGKVNAFQTSGTNNTVHQQSIDFVLQTIGNWTSV